MTNVGNHVRAMCYTSAVGLSPTLPTLSDMKVTDESEAEIDEALAYLSAHIRTAEDFRKVTLLEFIDELLDAKLEKAKA